MVNTEYLKLKQDYNALMDRAVSLRKTNLMYTIFGCVIILVLIGMLVYVKVFEKEYQKIYFPEGHTGLIISLDGSQAIVFLDIHRDTQVIQSLSQYFKEIEAGYR